MAEVQLVMDMRMREKTRIGIIELSQSISQSVTLWFCMCFGLQLLMRGDGSFLVMFGTFCKADDAIPTYLTLLYCLFLEERKKYKLITTNG